MTHFGYLKELDVSTDKTVKYTFHQITVGGKTPTLIVAPATEVNKPYFNALLKSAGKSARRVRTGNINAGMIDENRDEDRGLYPKHIVKGWHDTVDVKGKEVVFSVDEAQQFLDALPNWLFDEFREFCRNPANFVELMDIETNAGN